MLQIRLYVLYRRSNKLLVFLAICFLAEVAIMLRMYIDFSSTVQGQPKELMHSSSETFDHARQLQTNPYQECTSAVGRLTDDGSPTACTPTLSLSRCCSACAYG